MAANDSNPDPEHDRPVSVAGDDLARFFAERPGDESGSTLNDDPQHIGRRLTEAREAAGMTRHELAAHLGLEESTIERWETGERSPRGNRVSKLAGILGVSLSWILVGRGVEPAGADHEVAQIRAELHIARDRLNDVIAELADLDRRLASLGEG